MSPSLMIDSLHLRLSGIDPELARDAVSRLGPALEQALAGRSDLALKPHPKQGPLILPNVSLTSQPASAAALARRLADEILASTSSSPPHPS